MKLNIALFILIILGLIYSCDKKEPVEYPLIYSFDELVIGESKVFVQEENGSELINSEFAVNDFHALVEESLDFEYLGFPFDKITVRSEEAIDLEVAEFTGDPQTFNLSYIIKSGSEILVDFGEGASPRFVTFIYKEGSEFIEICFQTVGYTFYEDNVLNYSSADTDICQLGTNIYETLANTIANENDLVVGDSIFVNYSKLVYRQ